jgi:hypothetical protein
MRSRERNRQQRSQHPSQEQRPPCDVQVGVVGLGMMWRSIATCLLASYHPVVGFEADAAKRPGAMCWPSSARCIKDVSWQPLPLP